MSISLKEIHLALDRFSQIQKDGKLCFRGNEVAIESSSSVLRTSASWWSYASGSGWSRDIKDLTAILNKISRHSYDQLDGEQILILVNKIQEATKGLKILEDAYSYKEVQKGVVGLAISDLQRLSTQLQGILISIGDQMRGLRSENESLKLENAELKAELAILKEHLQKMGKSSRKKEEMANSSDDDQKPLMLEEEELTRQADELEREMQHDDQLEAQHLEFDARLPQLRKDVETDRQFNLEMMNKWGFKIPTSTQHL